MPHDLPGTERVMLSRILPVIILALLVVTGCQSTKGQYDVRVWADVNSLGAPAAFIDQTRISGFRSESPGDSPDAVETIRIETGANHETAQTFPVFPLETHAADPGPNCVQNGSDITTEQGMGSDHSKIHPMSHSIEFASDRSPNASPLPGTPPPGAWLF